MALLDAIEAIEAAETGDPIQVDADVRNPIFVSRSMYRSSLRLDVRLDQWFERTIARWTAI
jgi:hypothetical protein